MRITCTLVLSLSTLAACTPDSGEVGSFDESSGSDPDDGGGSSGGPGGAESTDDSGSSGGGEEGGSESEGGADGSSGGDDEPSPLCSMPDDTVSAMFDVDAHDWPGNDEFEIDVDVDCTIVDMGLFDGVVIEPTLECDLDGDTVTATITMDDPNLLTGDGHPLLPAFDVGELVRFRHWGVQDAGGLLDGVDEPVLSHFLLEQFSMHTPDGRLLAAGFDSWDLRPEMHAPVAIEEDSEFCGMTLPFPDDPERPMAMTFTHEDTSIEIIGGHGGLIDPDGFGDMGISIAAELAQAGGCCHTDRQYRILMIDMTLGEG